MATYNVLAYDSTNNLPTLPNTSDTVNVAGEATFAKSVVDSTLAKNFSIVIFLGIVAFFLYNYANLW